MKKLMVLLLSAALLTGLPAGCTGTPAENSGTSTPVGTSVTTETSMPEATGSDTEEGAWPRTIEDDFGHKVTLEKKPERVVLMYFGDIEASIVLGTAPVGAPDADIAMNGLITLKQYAAEIEIIDLGSRREPSMERILEVSPDLIIGRHTFSNAYDDLNKIAPTLLFEINDYKDCLRSYAKCLGAEKEAEQYIAEIDALMIEAREKLSGYADKTFVFVWDLGKNTFGAFGKTATSQQAYFDKEIGFGLTPPEGYPEEYGQISLESLADFDPDYIFIIGQLGSKESGYQQIYLQEGTTESAIWQSLKAVKAENVYFCNSAGLNYSTPLGVKLAIETIVDSVVKE